MENGNNIDIDTILKNHAPDGWESYFSKEKPIQYFLTENEALNAVVMVADIRKSTILMKESVDFRLFADGIRIMVEEIGKGVRKTGGWYDKFTGDGFIVYWLYQSKDNWNTLLPIVIKAAELVINIFNRYTSELFRRNIYNYPEGTGISIGIDAGNVYLTSILDDLTIVGTPVVGAVRMVDAASNPGEIICNNYPGNWIFNKWESEGYLENEIKISRVVRATKEYSGQEVYLLDLLA